MLNPSSGAWLSERRRAGLACAVAVVVAVVLVLVSRTSGVLAAFDTNILVLLSYLVVYFVVTAVGFGAAPSAVIRCWAHRERRGTLLQRYLLGTAPGPGVSIVIAAAALVVAVVWLPQRAGGLAHGARIAVAGALVSVAWLCVLVSFAVAYYADQVIESDGGLSFPGHAEAAWADYVYFAVSVMTTFGTTDVTITSRLMRRTVTTNAVIAFVFNTVTVAALVSALTGI